MDMGQAEWYRRSLGFGDDWAVDDVEYVDLPLSAKVHVGFVGVPLCPVCGNSCPVCGSRDRVWKGPDLGSARCFVTARVPLVRCVTCGVHEIDYPWV